MKKYGQPSISRETRLLLLTIAISVASLWLLARIRFQDRPAAAAAVPPVLAQLRPQSTYDDLARSLSQLRPTVLAAIVADDERRPALRIGSDAGIALAGFTLATVRLPQGEVPSITPWMPRTLDYPRYLVAADVFDEGLSLRPVFVGSLSETESPVWSSALWQVPPHVDLSPGTFVFTIDGSLAGIVVEHVNRRAILPATHIFEAATHLRGETPATRGDLGLTARPTVLGLAVAWVDPGGPGAGHIMPTDIIEAINGTEIQSLDHWLSRVDRIAAGESVTLRVRRRNDVLDTKLVAVPNTPAPGHSDLGLRLRASARIGVEVLAVDPHSVGARARILPGDVISAIDGRKISTPREARAAFDAIPERGRALVAITRGSDHHVLIVEK
jgi:hypothetical protein